MADFAMAACFACGDAAHLEPGERAGRCGWCGEPLAHLTVADAPALDAAWLDGEVDDLTYERLREAFAAAIAEENAAAAAREREAAAAGRRYLKLRLRAVTQAEAFAFVDEHHRHHKPPRGWMFGVGLEGPDGELRGVIVVGRPVARMIATRDRAALEVTRCCVLPGTPNGASMLYGWAWRAARKAGFTRLITYILESETGGSLVAAGWRRVARSRGGSWGRGARPRIDKAPTCPKWRWEISARAA